MKPPNLAGWILEPHICRACQSRLLSKGMEGTATRHFLCSNCGLEDHGTSASCLCFCGMKLRRPSKTGRTGPAEIDAGIRCVPNPAPTAEFPSLIVAMEVAATA